VIQSIQQHSYNPDTTLEKLAISPLQGRRPKSQFSSLSQLLFLIHLISFPVPICRKMTVRTATKKPLAILICEWVLTVTRYSIMTQMYQVSRDPECHWKCGLVWTMHIEFVTLFSFATCVLLVLQRGKAIKGKMSSIQPLPFAALLYDFMRCIPVADDDANGGLLFREKAVQEGESIQCECAVDGLPPYYYYKYSNRTGLTFLRRSNQQYLLIDNISADYHNTFVCCQSRSMKLLLTAMICYHMNVTCECV